MAGFNKSKQSNKNKDEAEELDRKFFKLAENRQIFWDPAQTNPDNRKLLAGQVKELEVTEFVTKAKRGEHILPADQDDIRAYQKELQIAADKKAKADEEKELARK